MNKLIKKTILIALLIQSDVYGKKNNRPVAVRTITTKLEAIADEYTAIGTLKASESVDITSTVTEIITAIKFTDGQRVEKGDILVEMDTAEEMALLAEERSRYQEAKRQVKRLKPLVRNGAASASALDTSQKEYETAKARMAAIDSRINLRIIRAPFSGILGLRHISVGAVTQPGSRITTLDADELMNLDFAIPEPYLTSIKLGGPIEAQGKALPDKVLKGKIAGIDSRIDPGTRTILVRAVLSNEEKQLRPGMLLEVKVKKNPRQAILLPEEAVLSNGSKHFVFMLMGQEQVDDKAQLGEHENADSPTYQVIKQEIEIGRRLKGKVEVLRMLDVGTQVVTHGLIKLRDGAKVTISSKQT